MVMKKEAACSSEILNHLHSVIPQKGTVYTFMAIKTLNFKKG
jgi:hypothetical protein